jgi:predicted TIM-barrel fold metal-dependent hydrolase
MPYANDRLYLDADSHTVETVDWVERFADPAIRDRLAPLDLATRNTKATFAFINAAVEAQQQRATIGEKPADVIRGKKGWHAPGAFDSVERSAALDDLGFARQLVFSTYAGVQYLWHEDVEVRYGGCRAHNRAMAAFCAGDARLIGVGQVKLEDPARAVEEIREGVRLGLGAFWVPAMPAGEKSPGHPDLDPVWQAFCDLDIPFMIHVGPNSKTALNAYRANGQPTTRPPATADGGEGMHLREFLVLAVAPQQFLSALVFDGVFERFPTLRGGVIELGASWVPEYLRSLDMGQKIFGRSDPAIAALPMKASDYIRRAMKFTPFPGEDVGRMIADAGPDLFLFSSDYPHPEGTDDPIGRFERTLGKVDEVAKDKFYSGNFQEMMGAAG